MTKTYDTAYLDDNPKKLICGVAYNSRGKYKSKENKRPTHAYSVWRSMLRRCYGPKRHIEHPAYNGCTVSKEWHDFQDFAEWFYNHDFYGMGYQLDKDLLVKGNKVYSPATCCLIPSELNTMLVDSAAARGKHPQGLSFYKLKGSSKGKYKVNIRLGGNKQEYLGYYDCKHEAYRVYKAAKETHVKVKALEWRDRISNEAFTALMNWQLI